jgi:ATP-dependent RNA helicase SUPV3L1/SUV3
LGQLDWQVDNLSPELRNAAHALKRFGVRIGRQALFLPRMIRPASSALAYMLWAVHARLTQIPSPPAPGLTSFALGKDDDWPREFLAAAFFRAVGDRAVRLDILERVQDMLFEASRQGRNAAETLSQIVSLLGSRTEDAAAVAEALGWRRKMRGTGEDAKPVWQVLRKDKHPGKRRLHVTTPKRPDSPFAGLAVLISSD